MRGESVHQHVAPAAGHRKRGQGKPLQRTPPQRPAGAGGPPRYLYLQGSPKRCCCSKRYCCPQRYCCSKRRCCSPPARGDGAHVGALQHRLVDHARVVVQPARLQGGAGRQGGVGGHTSRALFVFVPCKWSCAVPWWGCGGDAFGRGALKRLWGAAGWGCVRKRSAEEGRAAAGQPAHMHRANSAAHGGHACA